MSDTPVRSRGRLAALGAYGFEAQEPVILAALTSGDPMLLIGRSGTGKTFLLNSISEALGLEHRHYNASLISFDDLVGFPYPDDAKVHSLSRDTRHGLGRSRCWWTRSAAANRRGSRCRVALSG